MSTLTLRGPAWLAVRQHRLALWSAPPILVIAAVIVVFLRLRADTAADSFASSGCSVEHTTFTCGSMVRVFLNAQFDYSHWLNNVGLPLFVLPGVVGAFVAGPMIARELESGTYKLAWTQSVAPARWLMVKLAVPTVWTVAFVSVAVPLYRWAWTNAPSRTSPPAIGTRRSATPGQARCPWRTRLLGIAVGALVGLLVRRTVLAMSLTLLAMGTVMLLFITRLGPSLADRDRHGRRAWRPGQRLVRRAGVVLASGKRVTGDECVREVGGVTLPGAPGRSPLADIHPVSHLWPLQLVETGIILVLAVAVTFAAFRVLGRRHG